MFGKVDDSHINDLAINIIKFGGVVAIVSIIIFVVLNRLRIPKSIAGMIGTLGSLYAAYRVFLFMFS